ncbi:glycosyltransferase family 1 protein [Nitratidesulfovibrio sp. SRB-5]|uniref:glycosyltransferase family 1 protein n=1 Tax=Nitratidesulfovibrio sp. SRB-5 TaxID=2872636 RepID=UPI001024C1F5|nr:glycosyltransferase family 1 protein [Nitratidesulfovibrio sp. SRB-5]MBZ2172756.1 glycosyltransferase family 1 protein [Nitratidesulfovibrio sp. SRB-5]RXF76500.1 glycosyltransferase family 1 protein [Desulfovibrio sp. DS-1]
MRTFLFVPPLPRMTGGLAVLYRMAAHLYAAGYPVFLVPREGGAPGLDPDNPPAPVMGWDEAAAAVAPQDVWLVPEGWVNALAPGLRAGARCVVYVQNWAYLLSSLPPGVFWPQLDVSFLAVSDPVAWYTREVTGREAPVLRPGIDLELFRPAWLDGPDGPSMPVGPSGPDKPDGDDAPADGDAGAAIPDGPAHGPVRIAWMPRKNRALAQQVRDLLSARLALSASRGERPVEVEWREIHGRSHAEVADLLRTSHVFLATGFPEGCPLPPLEALASGCLLVGFAGFGGWDYMRQALPGGVTPWWTGGGPKADPASGGMALPPNGYFAADADVVAAGLALERAVRLAATGGPELAALRRAGLATARACSLQRQRATVLALWERVAKGELFPPART